MFPPKRTPRRKKEKGLELTFDTRGKRDRYFGKFSVARVSAAAANLLDPG